jgi:hypothetical protein
LLKQIFVALQFRIKPIYLIYLPLISLAKMHDMQAPIDSNEDHQEPSDTLHAEEEHDTSLINATKSTSKGHIPT